MYIHTNTPTREGWVKPSLLKRVICNSEMRIPPTKDVRVEGKSSKVMKEGGGGQGELSRRKME